MLRSRSLPLLVGALALTACDKPPEPTTAPDDAAQTEAKPEGEDAAAEAGEGEQEEKAPAEDKEKKDSFTVATFNLGWAHDNIGGGPKASEANKAKTDKDWEWKAKGIGQAIAKEKPDIIALHELGGSGEINDIVDAIEKAKGPKYEWAFEESDDPRNGHHCAILSRFPVSNERRFDLHLRRHVAADVELPTGDQITLVAIHAPEGTRPNAIKARQQQVKALDRELKKIRAERPLIVLGTLGSEVAPGDDAYKTSAAGMLAGANTGKDDDDCDDSADVGPISETTTNGALADRIFTCGLQMRSADVAGQDSIVKEATDPWDKPWSDVPIDKDPHRDVSDHLIVVADVAFPKPPPKEEEKKEGEGEKKKD